MLQLCPHYRDAHRRIFDKMVKLAERGDAIDLVTLKEELGRSGDLEEVGGPAYITALVDGVPRSTNVEYYVKIIKRKSILRKVSAAAIRIERAVHEAEPEDAFALASAASAEFDAIALDSADSVVGVAAATSRLPFRTAAAVVREQPPTPLAR